MDAAISVNGVPIRLTYERWYHIVENHDDLASRFHDVLDAIENPEFVLRGNAGALKAARNLGGRNWLIAVYREVSKSDGFVITAYVVEGKPKGEIVWQQA